MNEPVGLRERKKARTRTAISEAAITLFLARGYDNVSVAEIAATAEVSKRTLFAYFPTKDDLVLHRFADHENEPAEVVRDRRPDESPIAALLRHRRAGLADRDPITGLCDHPQVVEFYRLVISTPALNAALVGYVGRGETTLAAALHDAAPDSGPLAARLAAVQISAVQRTLSAAVQTRIMAGSTADELADDAFAETGAEHAARDRGLQS